MATKEQWIELINLKLSGGDAPASIQGKYSLPEIEHYLTLAFNDVLAAAWAQDHSMLNDYIKSKKYTIKYDAVREERYIQVDATILPLPDNSGYVQLKYPKNPNLQFALLDVNSLPIFAELEVGRIDTKVGYYIESQKVIFDRNLPKVIEDIMLKYITSFGGLSDDDEVVVPGGNNQAVFSTVYQLMAKALPSVNQDNMVDKQV